MLSKQDKLKYGQDLRRQMKEKQEKKRTEEFQKRGIKRSPTDPRNSYQPESYQVNKQVLQNKFASDNVDYYGRPGGGAPNRPNIQQYSSTIQYQVVPQFNSNIPIQIPKIKTIEQQLSNQDQLNYNQNYIYNQAVIQQQPLDSLRPIYNDQTLPYPRANIPVQHPSINNNLYIPPNYSQYQNYPPQFQNQDTAQTLLIPSDRTMVEQYQQFQQQKPKQSMVYNQQRNNVPQGYKNQGQAAQIYQTPLQQISEKHQANLQKIQQHEQLMQIHKRGGRNLLKLENMTIDEQQVKQKQKQEMKRQLELQIKETQDRKKQQLEKKHKLQLEQQRKNNQYLKLQQRRNEEEEMKKIQKLKNIQMQNIKNIEERKKIQLEANSQLNKMKPRGHSAVQHSSLHNSPKQTKKSHPQLPGEETISQNSSSSDLSNDKISKHYLQKERKKDQQRYNRQKNIEVVTDQIRRLKDQIDEQQHLFLKQIQKVKLSSEAAQHEKRKRQAEIESLKMQLKQKMQHDNQRLFQALQRQDQLGKQQTDNYNQLPKKNFQKKQLYNPNDYYVESMKPGRNQKFVKKQYQMSTQQPKRTPQPPPPLPPPQYQQNYTNNFQQSAISQNQSMMVSLHGDSKKIPLNIPDKLTMSKVGDFARQTQFFRNSGDKNIYDNHMKNHFGHQESIQEVDQNRGDSRNMQRQANKYPNSQRDVLNKYAEHSKNEKEKRWGEMSSVNDDITKQIEQLLKKKDNQRPPSTKKYQNNYQQKYNERPSSNLSKAGKRALSQGLQYQGVSIATIKSNTNTGGNGTLDIDKIHNKNQRRLNQLRNLGVQTINTNNDDQFVKLDQILNKYKQNNGE